MDRSYITVRAAATLIGKSEDTVWRYLRETEADDTIGRDIVSGLLVLDAHALTAYVATRPTRGRPRKITTRTEH